MQKQPEIWKFIPEMKMQYQISNKGRVKRPERLTSWNNKEKVLPEIIIKQKGKLNPVVTIKGKKYKISYLMELTGFTVIKNDPRPMKRSKEKKTYNKRIGFGLNFRTLARN